MALQIVLGLVAALVLVLLGIRIYRSKAPAAWGIGLVIAALIYVAFAIAGQAWDWLPVEIGGVVLYGFFFWLSRRFSPIWLAVGWFLHVGWDLFLHPAGHPGYVPAWYPGVCLGFDILIGIYLLLVLRL